ncbi:MAG TPA: GFA family protein [Vitreimonas sp.]|uniref:GFA family protein n=1 Tax=Vitreimonas sp. TaxID=3069702 RepID=UPI002D23C657|nr:GFA family protein [Vitreimonas sp.]HYD86380.1 GFA family protein [Vitreimonas sp.]
MSIEGGCHCGSVRYALFDEHEASMICHCATCRRVSGGVVVAWVTVAFDAFEVTKGTPRAYASSEGVTRQFCGECGTQLTCARADDADYIDIATTTLDDPNAFPPTHHSWLRHDHAWVRFGDGLPKFPKSRYG